MDNYVSAQDQSETAAFAARVAANQAKLAADLKPQYDFIVCGSGSSGSVVARRLAENPEVSVLLLEAGGTDNVPSVTEAAQWTLNRGSERDWGYRTQPDPKLEGRSIAMTMGKVLGGGSSINVMVWARGHKHDWDFFAEEAGDDAWNYQSALDIYRRVEDWQGPADPSRRGQGGPLFIQPAPQPHPMAPALLEGAQHLGIPLFESPNGRLMETEGGCSLNDVDVREGRRMSIFQSYVFPLMAQPNLTVLTQAVVMHIIFEGKRAVGVEFVYAGGTQRITATREVVLSLGAVQTPKVLMQSGIGDQAELQRHGIPVREHLPGVGQNFQNHLGAANCVWEYPESFVPHNSGAEAVVFWKSDTHLDTPGMQIQQVEYPLTSPEGAVRFNPPPASWALFPCIFRPQSRGHLRLSGPHPEDLIEIYVNAYAHPDDMKAMVRCVELSRDLGSSKALRPYVKREVAPGNLKGAELEQVIRQSTISVHHQFCTAKMGRASLSVVDSHLKVYGIDGLRIADASILPRVTTGNTMAPCVVIGERAAEMLRSEHQL